VEEAGRRDHESRGNLTGELGHLFNSAQPTISKHLKVLEQAGLVERKVVGPSHRFRLRPEPLGAAERWIERHSQFWRGAVGQLEKMLLEDPHEPS
jgi:DNA-binding transcriptional ArsR family regulator